MGNGTCTALVPFPQAIEDSVQPASQSAAHQAAVDRALAARNNATLGALPLLGEYPHGHITAQAQYGLGQAGILARATGTDPHTGLKLGQVTISQDCLGFEATHNRGSRELVVKSCTSLTALLGLSNHWTCTFMHARAFWGDLTMLNAAGARCSYGSHYSAFLQRHCYACSRFSKSCCNIL